MNSGSSCRCPLMLFAQSKKNLADSDLKALAPRERLEEVLDRTGTGEIPERYFRRRIAAGNKCWSHRSLTPEIIIGVADEKARQHFKSRSHRGGRARAGSRGRVEP